MYIIFPLIKTYISEDADYIFDGITGTLPFIGGVPKKKVWR